MLQFCIGKRKKEKRSACFLPVGGAGGAKGRKREREKGDASVWGEQGAENRVLWPPWPVPEHNPQRHDTIPLKSALIPDSIRSSAGLL